MTHAIKQSNAVKSYYSFDRIRSYNATYMGVVGGRGLGKTYGAKEIALTNSIRKIVDASINQGEEFVLLRRYKEELSEARRSFFADIKGAFPGWEFKLDGDKAIRAKVLEPIDGESDAKRKAREKKRQWVTMGYFVALSTSSYLKGRPFPLVTTIIFDEFIIETGTLQYLKNEVKVFNDFFSTVDRWKDKTKVFFLSNSVEIMNPYFLAWNIRPDENKEFIVRQQGFIVFHFPDAAEFQSEVYQTKFGRFIEGTDYADYAVGNTFSDNHGLLVGSKTSDAAYRFTLETRVGWFSVWRDGRDYAIQAKRPRGDETLFTLLPERVNEDVMLMEFSDKPLSILRTAWRTGKIKFDEDSTRNTFIEIFDRK